MTAPRRIVGLVLAAGSATRFGGDKLLHPLVGRPLGEHIAITLAGMTFAARLAVCPSGNRARHDLFARHGFEVIDNAEPGRGMGTSLALGAEHALSLEADALLVCLADMPFVTPAHIARLIAVDAPIVATECDGVRSPPALFGRQQLPALAALTGDTGARRLLAAATCVIATPQLMRDFDTPENFR